VVGEATSINSGRVHERAGWEALRQVIAHFMRRGGLEGFFWTSERKVLEMEAYEFQRKIWRAVRAYHLCKIGSLIGVILVDTGVLVHGDITL
jgi:hypothetical protein